MDRDRLLEAVIAACWEAGDAILAVRRRGFATEWKSDRSPVTEADHAAEAIILKALALAAPGVAVVAEEEAAAGRLPDCSDLFFLVDPLDGTRDFVRGGNDYTVNVGLVRREGPVLGVVLSPERGQLFAGIVGKGAFIEQAGARRPINVAQRCDPPVVVASKSHLNAATSDYIAVAAPEAVRTSVGSSLKFCLVADGSADFYPRLSPTSEWDTAAGHALLVAAGGRVDGLDGEPLRYGKANYLNPGFLATSGWEAPLPVTATKA